MPVRRVWFVEKRPTGLFPLTVPFVSHAGNPREVNYPDANVGPFTQRASARSQIETRYDDTSI
jgi:hypothetical protein